MKGETADEMSAPRGRAGGQPPHGRRKKRRTQPDRRPLSRLRKADGLLWLKNDCKVPAVFGGDFAVTAVTEIKKDTPLLSRQSAFNVYRASSAEAFRLPKSRYR